ncbi:MAG: hypothetical protein LBN42_01360 [Oscillospiraceae bacterium]|jgi:stage III sporulation protein AA|nr:hypothetical protein [Oscillospiraceae bacterium]
MIQTKRTELDYIAEYLPFCKNELLSLPPDLKRVVREIRVRVGQPIFLETDKGRVALNSVCAPEFTEELLKLFTRYSVHSYEKQLAEGLLTLVGGHRVGICGTAVVQHGVVTAMRDITSYNIRVAREIVGAADTLYDRYFPDNTANFTNLIILGKPLSGKTTVLRDLARIISKTYKCTIIDERGEIAAKSDNRIRFDLGANTDVLDLFPKGAGILTAIRGLSPDFVLCDEITAQQDELRLCANSGVSLIMTAHAATVAEYRRNIAAARFAEWGMPVNAVLLGTGKDIGKIKEYGSL